MDGPLLLPPIDHLRRALPQLSPRLREVGAFLTDHEFDATTRSMRELAASAGLNPATFTRLAQALGYKGWDDLRNALIEAGRPIPAAPFSARVPGASATDRRNPLWIAQAMLGTDAQGLARIAPGPIAAAATALHAAPHAWVAGFRSSRSVAELLQYQLRLFRSDVVNLVGGAGPEDLDYGSFGTGHALVIVGFAPYTRASIATVRAACAAGCVVIAIADTPGAPIAQGVDHLLLFEAAAGPGFFPSLTGAVSQAQALVAAVFALGGRGALVRLRQAEARLSAHAQYVADPGDAGQ